MSGDKTAGQWLGSAIGATIGFLAGGAPGAVYGASVGATIGGMLDPPKGPSVQGPRLEDLSVQTSQFGAPLARGHGKFAVSGTVIYIENNQLKETVKKTKQGGKGGGGGGTTVTTYSYFATFAVALADMPAGGVQAVGRIWVGPDLIYNGFASDLETVVASNQTTDNATFGLTAAGTPATIRGRDGVKFKVYPGTDDQLADTRIEAELGAGNAPAFRGTAYIIFYDLPLEKYGNSLLGAQVKVELVSGSITSTGVPHITTVNALGPSQNSIDLTGCVTPLTASAGSQITVLKNFAPMQLNKISSSGRVRVSSLSVSSSYVCTDGWSDEPAWAAIASNTALVFNGNAFTVPTSSTTLRYVHKYGDRLVYFYSPTNGGISAVVYDYSDASVVTSSTQLADYYIAAIVDESDIVAIKDDGLTITVFDQATLTAQTTITLSSVWPGLSQLSALTAIRNTAACVDGDLAYFFTPQYESLLIVDLVAEAEVARLDVDLPYYNASRGGTISVRYGVFSVFDHGSDTSTPSRVMHFRLNGFSDSLVPLSDVTLAELVRSELIASGDVDVTDLASDYVRGYRLPGIQQIRNCIGPLQMAWPFDIIMDGYTIKAVRRGNASAKTISSDDLDARPYGTAPGVQFEQSREMDSQLPSKVLLKYIDAEREHDVNQQPSAERQSSSSVQVRELDLPIVFNADEAAQAANTVFNMNWLERYDYRFKLPPTHLDLQPSDVVTIQTDYGSFELLINLIDYLANGCMECSARPNAAAVYTQQEAVGGVGTVPAGTIALSGDAEFALMDIPLIRNADDEPGFAAAMAGTTTSWPGGALYRSTDNEQTWDLVQAWSAPVTMGIARDPLTSDDGYVIDRTSTLIIDLLDGTLDSITEAQMMTGLHYVAYGSDQRWELLRFVNATLNSDGSYTVDTLLRGLKGTEQYTGTHEEGDYFVLLDDIDVYGIGADLQYLNVVRQWRGLSVGQELDDVLSTSFAYRGVNLKPLSGVNGLASLSGSDWIITWDRRTRLTGSLWTTGTELPSGETSVSFEIDVLDTSTSPATVVRTISATTESVTYTAAQQAADFGSPLPSSLNVKVYQISATVGRGYVLEITG